ncbi:MAG: hypothetical protein HRT44_09205 [Bdellovibrionales bacterium]|nr:hypothetical protein [Bdellovibrionales bacterium]
MNFIITHAIEHCELLSFTYNGITRIVEPHAYGVTKAGNEILRAYQVKGGHVSVHNQPWHLFSLSKINGLSSTGDHFLCPRFDYRRNDSAMISIYVQL